MATFPIDIPDAIVDDVRDELNADGMTIEEGIAWAARATVAKMLYLAYATAKQSESSALILAERERLMTKFGLTEL